MKKAIKISAVLVALVVLAAMAFVFTSSAAEVCGTVDEVKNVLAQEDKTVELSADIGSDADLTVYNVAGKVILDLKGKKITSGVTGSLFVQEGVANPVEFVIKDSVGGGAIIAPDAYLLGNFGGTVKIEGGTIVAKGIIDPAATKNPVVTIAQSKADRKGTWTSFDPTSCLVLGFAATNSPSTVDARATFYVAPAVYNITYNLPDGANNPNAGVTTYTIWDEVKLKPATADGYTFKGWFLKDNNTKTPLAYDDNGNTVSIYQDSLYYNIEILGEFEPTVYNITYAGTGYTNHTNNLATFKVTDPNIKLGAASKVGYEFLGWFTAENGGGTAVTQIECSTTYNDVVLYPHFKAIEYKINYVTYGGTPIPTKVTYTIEEEFDFETVTRPGYTFVGWYSVAVPGDDDAEVTGVEKGTIGDITVYAQYETIDYTVTFGDSDKIVTDVEDITFTVETPTFFLPVPELKPGYTFVGWQDSLGTIVTAIPVGTHTDIDLQPVIKTTVYKIFYVFGTGVLNSEVNNDVNASTWYEFTITDAPKLVAPSRAHYNFLGWSKVDPHGVATEDLKAFLDENGLDYDDTTKTWNIPEGTANNVYVYAVWECKEYGITYDPDGYTFEILANANKVPILDANGDVQYVDENGNVTTDPSKFVKVPFDDDKSVLTEDAPAEYTYFDDVKIPTPTRLGYEFVRWYDENTGTYLTPDANGEITIAKGTRSGDLNLVAEWAVKKYKVVIKYQFNDDYYNENKDWLVKVRSEKTGELLYPLDEGRTIKVAYENEVVFGTPIIHEVDFKVINGFVPHRWNIWKYLDEEQLDFIEVDENGNETIGYVVYFEALIKSTKYENGNLIITYHDDTTRTVAINDVSGVKYDGGKLVYVDANGNETTVAYATSADLATAVETINTALATLKTQVEANKADIAALKAALVDLAKINENAEAIANLKTTVADIQAQIDALSAKNGTYLVLIIIIAVISVAAAAGVVVLFVKKK